MANFNIQITNRGKALQAKAQAGTPLVFTRMRLGSGSLSGQQIADMTALVDPKLWLSINKSVASTTGRYTVGAYLSSDNVTTGFYFREWGVFAQDPDLGEILYCYGNVGAGAEYIAAGGGSDSVEKQLDAITIIGNAANVSAVLDESLVFTSRSEFENHTNAEELDHPDGSVTAAKLANGAANDDKIGERTISDAAAPTSNKGKLTVLLSGLANMYKAVTGEETWRTLPSTTIKAIKAILDAATNLATANTFMKRDANGRAKVAAPSATDDIARKAEVDDAITTAASDATTKANAAQSAAITAAASDATSKANAVQSNLNTHTSDKTVHITSTERTSWNAKETTTGAQAKADAAKSAAATDATTKANAAQSAAISAAAADATSKANAVQSNLNAHAADSTKHITSAERTAWNAKETTTGAQSKADAVQSNLNSHSADMVKHITSGERATWNNKLDVINLTGHLQTVDYRRSVIALCSVDNTYQELSSYSSGSLIFKRPNGIFSMIKINVSIEKKYNTSSVNVVYDFNSIQSDIPVVVRPCTFTYNGSKYGGLEVYINPSFHRIVEFAGSTNFSVFGLDYWNAQTNAAINIEVANSIEFTSPTIRKDYFFGGLKLPLPDGTMQTDLNADLLDGFHASANASNNTVALRSATGNLSANTFYSQAPQGTQPFNVLSSTTVTNLNSDSVDGFHATVAENPNTIAVRNANGDIGMRAAVLYAPQGVAPLNVQSTTTVPNLSAERVNGIKMYNSLTTPVGASSGDLWFPPS